ncbi:uracil-DNA glycosylase family protein [Mesorhizobium sp. W050]
MYRIKADTGEILVPHRFADTTYGAADPALGRERHHIANRVKATTLDELRTYLRRGWPIWMEIRGTRDRRLISADIVDAEPPALGDAVPAEPVSRQISIERVVKPAPAQKVPWQNAPIASHTERTLASSGNDKDYIRLVREISLAELAGEIENPRTLLMGSHVYKSKRLDIAYAPFGYVNAGADIVIVGITPGRQQMREALLEAKRAMASGASREDILARAKVHASFAGDMRKNLVRLMDAVGLNDWLGITSTATLWTVDSQRAHFTSAIRYPTFVDGENYSRSPDMNKVPFLFDKAREWLTEELSAFPNAVFVPMGDMVSEVLARIGGEVGVPERRILTGMPHASGANNGPIAWFLGAQGEENGWRRRYVDIRNKVTTLDQRRGYHPNSGAALQNFPK